MGEPGNGLENAARGLISPKQWNPGLINVGPASINESVELLIHV